ncbi:DUF2470 domain-containing protein [Kineosporia sp. R_H_3]|uniref:DUF2470 domain-containing protein n=1 Tax=Kineosporia sp. R_H_3 TaxID=1961848 RepID=UPI00117ADA03|nr:DUF2470 domain-containing protein [Kineosporia sp. R_H_3]
MQGAPVPVAARARTILAAAVRVAVRSGAADVAQPVAVVADEDGDVYLVDRDPGGLAGLPVEIRWRARDRALGELVLGGRCGPAVPLRDVPLGDLSPSGGCACPGLADVDGLVAAPVRAERVQLVERSATGDVVRRAVPQVLFRAARPDPWTVRLLGVAEHLERDHQAELRALAGARGGPAGTSAVTVRSLAGDGLVLACLTGDGVTDVVVRFRTPVRDLDTLGAWFRVNTPLRHDLGF